MFRYLNTIIKTKLGLLKIINEVVQTKEIVKRQEKRTEEIYWGMVFNNAVANSNWLLNKSFYPGRWAAGYPLLYILYRIFNDIKPKNVLELGLGESTKLAYQYYKANSSIDLRIIEHDKEWLEFFCNEFYDVSGNISLLEIKTTIISGCEVNEYDNLLNVIEGKEFDLICVDGPKGSAAYSRHQVVDIAKRNLLSDDFIIIIDDYHRDGEKQTADDLRKVFKEQGKTFVEWVYSGEKDSLLICSEKYRFLTSL